LDGIDEIVIYTLKSGIFHFICKNLVPLLKSPLCSTYGVFKMIIEHINKVRGSFMLARGRTLASLYIELNFVFGISVYHVLLWDFTIICFVLCELFTGICPYKWMNYSFILLLGKKKHKNVRFKRGICLIIPLCRRLKSDALLGL
jgi:hypothetical protein